MTSIPDPSNQELIAGRYALVRQLAVGGMAEVWLARQRGLEGFEKLVVVKRILPHLAKDPEFVQMFLDEARTAADLRHSNIASVTDVGTESGAYFIAMEYLHGQDLTHIVQRCRVLGERIPLQNALQIVTDAALGLDYSHRKVDRNGEAQQIVHRDVSPQNVLVTYEGATKVLDFGIASASHRSTHTEAGVVKGKYAYMSPEQFDGTQLDGRSDLFSLGVVLWELVTLQRLFWRPSDAETLRAVMECKIPNPSQINLDCPLELEAIILRALSRNPSQRYSSCAELALTLDGLLEQLRMAHSPARVGIWLRQIFPEHSLDPTEVPVAPPSAPGARTRNEKPPPLPFEGSKTDCIPSKEGPVQLPKPASDSMRALVKRVAPPAPFFGRPLELAQLQQHFDQKAPLVTITGTAGQGKARLAARSIELHGGRWNGKTWTVELSQTGTPEAVVSAVRIGCGLEQDGVCETSEQLQLETGRQLAAIGPGLVVLQNLELPTAVAAELISSWRRRAPDLSFLVTRPSPLQLPDEKVLALAGLDVRGTDCEAVRMFSAHLERVGVSAPSTPVDLEWAADICSRLQGIPLAIELVASAGDQLRLDATLEKLNAAGGRSAIQAALELTCGLLSEPERQALIQLSVFRSGFTLEAADQILSVAGNEEISGLMSMLVQRSLLRTYIAAETPGRVRFSLPAYVRSWASAALEASGRLADLRANHAQWYTRRAEEWVADLEDSPSADRLARLSVERENLHEVYRAAIAVEPATPASTNNALLALHGLYPFLARMGPYGVHLQMLDAGLLAAASTTPARLYVARAMQQRANVQRDHNQPVEALKGMTEALKVVRQADDRALEGRILCDWSLACFVNADVDRAVAGLEKSLEIARAIGDGAAEVKALALQAMVYVARRDLTRALKCCDLALPLARNRGDAVSEARVLGSVGSLFLEERRTELSRAFFSDAVARCAQVDELALKGYFLGKLAQVLAECGELEEARTKVAAGLKLLRQFGDQRNEGLFLTFSGWLEAVSGRPNDARAELKLAQVKLEAVRDPLLLTVLALRQMHLALLEHEATPDEARRLLGQVRKEQGEARARIAQSDEVRLAALQLERSLRGVTVETVGVA